MIQTVRTYLPKTIVGVAIVLFLASAIALVRLALVVHIDYFDGFKFLLQAARLTEADYQFIRFDFNRPRALVLFLSGLNGIHRSVAGTLPALFAYKLMSVAISLCCVAAWWRLLGKLFNPTIAAGACLLFLCQEWLFHFGAMIQSDFLAGLLIPILLAAFFRAGREFEAGRGSLLGAMGVGVLGGLTSLSKNHLTLLFPALWIIWELSHRRVGLGFFRKARRHFLVASLMSYVVSLDLITRIWGRWGEGFPEHFRHVFLQARHQVTEATPVSLYAMDLYHAMGPLLFCLVGICAAYGAFCVIRVRSASLLERARWTVTVFTLSGLLFTQAISHREIRYLIPFLIPLFAISGWGARELLLRFPKWVPLWAGIWILALFPSMARSFNEWTLLNSDPAFRFGLSDVHRYLGEDGRCERILVNRFATAPRGETSPITDTYYRRYDVEPQFEFFAKRPVDMFDLKSLPRSEPKEILKRIWDKNSASGTCLVFADLSGEPQIHTFRETSEISKLCVENRCYEYHLFRP